MELRYKAMVTFAVLVGLVMGLYYFSDWFSKTTGYAPGEDELLRLTSCLSEKGVKMYGSATCPDCEKQKDLFGKFFDKVGYHECVDVDGKCADIGALPAWKVNGELYYGVKDLIELGRLSGCNLNPANNN